MSSLYIFLHHRYDAGSCAPAPPRRRPRYPSLGALVSPRRFPRTVCILAVAIQLSMRFILLRRAKARWFLERGFPGSVFPRRAGALRL